MRSALLGSAAATAALFATGCGGTAGDLLSIQVSGGPTADKHTVVVSGDGRGTCQRGGALKPLPSATVIDAREIERGVKKLAHRAVEYPPRPGARRYVLSTTAGVVRWSEGTPGLPKDLPRAQLLALQLERRLCG